MHYLNKNWLLYGRNLEQEPARFVANGSVTDSAETLSGNMSAGYGDNRDHGDCNSRSSGKATMREIPFMSDTTSAGTCYKATSSSICLDRRIHMVDGISRVLNQAHYPRAEILEHARGGTVHPLVRKHPDTGEESINVNCANICFMASRGGTFSKPACDGRVKEHSCTWDEPHCSDGAEEAVFIDTHDSYRFLLQSLGDGKAVPTYEHKWMVGDWLLFDNRITLHSGPDLEQSTGSRLMYRVRLDGKY